MITTFKKEHLEPTLRARWQKDAEEKLREREQEISRMLLEKHGIELSDVLKNGD